MQRQAKDAITLTGHVLPPVRPHANIFLITTGNPPTQRRANASEMLLGSSQITELHWASLLDRTGEFTFKTDPANPDEPGRDQRGYCHLLAYKLSDTTNTAELVQLKGYGRKELDQLNGLMSFRTLARISPTLSRQSRQFRDALEIVQWGDGSITRFEYQRTSNGSMNAGTMLPPLGALEDILVERLDDDQDPRETSLRHLRDWKHHYLYTVLLSAISELQTAAGTETRADQDPILKVLLEPAREAAATGHQAMKQSISDHMRQNPDPKP